MAREKGGFYFRKKRGGGLRYQDRPPWERYVWGVFSPSQNETLEGGGGGEQWKANHKIPNNQEKEMLGE